MPGGRAPARPRDVIGESWRRIMASGIGPDEHADPVVETGALEMLRRSSGLMDVLDDISHGLGPLVADGLGVRDNYRATQNCAATSQPAILSPCIRYDGCLRELEWCSIPGMGHQIWASAAQAIWIFVAAGGPGSVLFANGFE